MSLLDSQNYEDLSGTGMHFTLMPVVGIRNKDAEMGLYHDDEDDYE